MPIYEYQCVDCGAVTDIKHGFKEVANEPCSKCGGVDLKRIFNPASIVFKGSGFYVTDSRKSSEPAKADGKPDAGTSETKTDSAKTETKADSGKSETKADSGKPETKSDSGKSDSKAAPGGKSDAAA